MRVRVNGEEREITASSLQALLNELDYDGSHFAIAVNYDVVPKRDWASRALNSGDEIEIITPRQGG
jgi:sulfur carrier protein